MCGQARRRRSSPRGRGLATGARCRVWRERVLVLLCRASLRAPASAAEWSEGGEGGMACECTVYKCKVFSLLLFCAGADPFVPRLSRGSRRQTASARLPPTAHVRASAGASPGAVGYFLPTMAAARRVGQVRKTGGIGLRGVQECG